MPGLHFSNGSRYFKPGAETACPAVGDEGPKPMSRRRISSMPAGMVVGALAVIALVAVIAFFVFSGTSDGASAIANHASRSEITGD